MKKIYFIIITVIILGSCSNPSGSDDGSQGTFSGLSVEDGTHLVIGVPSSVSSSSAVHGSTETPVLYEVSFDGTLRVVTYLDEDGNECTYEETPNRIETINDQWLALIFGQDDVNPDSAYLVRTSDWAVFEIPSDSLPYPDQWGRVFAGSGSTAYYLSSLWSVTDIWGGGLYYGISALQISATPTVQLLTPDTDGLSSGTDAFFSYNNDGDIGYSASFNGNPSSRVNRLRTVGGALLAMPADFSSDVGGDQLTWAGLDGEIYYLPYGTGTVTIQKVSHDGSTVATTAYGSAIDPTANFSSSSVKFETDNRIVFAAIESGNLSILEAYDASDDTPQLLTASPIDSIDAVTQVGENLYVAGTESGGGVVYEIDTAGGYSTTNVLPSGYQVFNLGPTGVANELLFHALRLSDAVRVMGTLDVDASTVEITDEGTISEVRSLARIQ